MRLRVLSFCSAVLALSACQRAEQRNETDATTAARSARVERTVSAPATSPQHQEANANAPLSEPNGPIDPKSAEAAGQVVQSFGALIEQNRWSEAKALWTDPASAAKFHGSLSDVADLHLEIGNPGDPEGAAGSIYVTVPAIFYGDLKTGQQFRRSADVILRRVNDVPGSTEAQRRWHIERIEWAS